MIDPCLHRQRILRSPGSARLHSGQASTSIDARPCNRLQTMVVTLLTRHRCVKPRLLQGPAQQPALNSLLDRGQDAVA